MRDLVSDLGLTGTDVAVECEELYREYEGRLDTVREKIATAQAAVK